MKKRRSKIILPIGRAARITCQIEALRADCCRAARKLTEQPDLNECELEECARLDDALAEAQNILKRAVGRIIFYRLKRRSRAGNAEH